MKVKFLKDHLDNKKGSVAEVETQRARYFINVGVAEESNEGTTEPVVEPKAPKKPRKPKTEKKVIVPVTENK